MSDDRPLADWLWRRHGSPPEPQLLSPRAPAPRLSVMPESWGLAPAAVTDREIPIELHSALAIRTPQALLRDLHRPVRDLAPVQWQPIDEGAPPAEETAPALIRAALARRPTPRIASSTRAMIEVQRWRRDLLSTPWQPDKPDDAPRRWSRIA